MTMAVRSRRKSRPRNSASWYSGDSFTYAVTQPAYSFCAVLQDALNRSGLGPDFRVVNLGVPGSSFPQYLEQYSFWSRALEYDAVIFNIYLGNDFQDMKEHPVDAKEFASRLAQIREQGMYSGLPNLIPRLHTFRFVDYLRAYFLLWSRDVPYLNTLLGTAHLRETSPDSRYKSLMRLSDANFHEVMRTSLQPYLPARASSLAGALPWLQALMGLAADERARGKKVLVMLSPAQVMVNEAIRARVVKAEGLALSDVDPSLPGRLARGLGAAAESPGAGAAQADLMCLDACLKDKTPDGPRHLRPQRHPLERGGQRLGGRHPGRLRPVGLVRGRPLDLGVPMPHRPRAGL